MSALHFAHQGVTGMTLTAQNSVFWTGMTYDIQLVRAKCQVCVKNAPSQPNLPPVEPFIPTTPFEAVAVDFFHFEGFYYLVIADRLSGWPDV